MGNEEAEGWEMCYCYALELAQRVLPRLFPKSKEADFA
jgi:hypothetical protein